MGRAGQRRVPDVRRRGVARDVTLIHLASMSNLAAALGWLLVDVLARPDAVARVRTGEEGFAEAAARESTRLAQPFAVIAMATALRRLVTALDLKPGWIAPRPVPAQVGGVARAVDPCPVVYRRRPS